MCKVAEYLFIDDVVMICHRSWSSIGSQCSCVGQQAHHCWHRYQTAQCPTCAQRVTGRGLVQCKEAFTASNEEPSESVFETLLGRVFPRCVVSRMRQSEPPKNGLSNCPVGCQQLRTFKVSALCNTSLMSMRILTACCAY